MSLEKEPEPIGTMIMKELDIVRLKTEFKGLSKGTEGTIVSEYDGTHFEVEFVDSQGTTIDVLTTPVDVLEFVTSGVTNRAKITNT